MDYDDMLDRAVEETPDGEHTSERFEVPEPELRQEGKASVFENFRAVCDRLGRDPEHVLQYLQGDVGTSGEIDERGRARLTGSFDADRIGNAIEEYVEQFVRCSACGLPDTQLNQDGETTVLRCEACGTRETLDGGSS